MPRDSVEIDLLELYAAVLLQLVYRGPICSSCREEISSAHIIEIHRQPKESLRGGGVRYDNPQW